MNNDNDLNLHLHDQMSGWLRHCYRQYTTTSIRFLGQTGLEYKNRLSPHSNELLANER